MVDPEQLESLEVRSRGLPEGHRGSVRLVEIEGVDLNTCGGTHLDSTAEIESLALLGTESIRGGTRLYFAAGKRVRDRLREHEERQGILRDLLDVGDDGIVEATRQRADKLTEANRAHRSWMVRWCDEVGERLAIEAEARGTTTIEAHWDDCDLKALQRIAGQLPESVFVLLTGGHEPRPVFC